MSTQKHVFNQEDNGILAGSLAVDGSTMARFWQSATLLVRTAKPAPLELGVDLADRLRGALGRALDDLRAAGDEGASALFELAFAGGERADRARVRPFVLAVEPEGAELVVQASLFGWHRRWMQTLRRALEAAFARGIAVRPGHRHRVPWPPGEAQLRWINEVRLAPPGDELVLDFRAPLVLRRRGGLSGRVLGTVDSVVRRLQGLAPTMGLELEIDGEAWHWSLRNLAFDDSDLRPVSWDRFSARDARVRQPGRGLVGRLRLAGDVALVAPLLTMGQLSHAGGRASLGYGRYRLLGAPHPLAEPDDHDAPPMPERTAAIAPGAARVVTSPGVVAYHL